jgi:hypothetical protein
MEPDATPPVSLDSLKHLIQAWSLRKALQLAGKILL